MIDEGSALGRVLVVDDDDDLRAAMAFCLRRAGYAVTAVATGAEAVAAAQAHRPEVAIVDLLLPDAGGPGLADTLRALDRLDALPVLFTTALAAQPVQAALPDAEVLFKPFTRDELVGRVTALWGARSAEPRPEARQDRVS
jgi:DNA-binding response OmpR family regulator